MHFASFHDTISAARVLKFDEEHLAELTDIHLEANWARHSPPPSNYVATSALGTMPKQAINHMAFEEFMGSLGKYTNPIPSEEHGEPVAVVPAEQLSGAAESEVCFQGVCRYGHPLQEQQSQDKYECDDCGCIINQGEHFVLCPACDYSLCSTCHVPLSECQRRMTHFFLHWEEHEHGPNIAQGLATPNQFVASDMRSRFIKQCMGIPNAPWGDLQGMSDSQLYGLFTDVNAYLASFVDDSDDDSNDVL